MMLRARRFAAIATTGLLILSAPLLAQDDPAPGPAEAARPAPRANPAARRVPPYFGQIGLTPDQRERIYSIRGDYQAQIDDLKRKIEELSAREMEECEAILTEAQLKLLEARRAARKGAATAEAGRED